MTTTEAIQKYNELTGNNFTIEQLSPNIYTPVEGQAKDYQKIQFRLFCCENGVEDTGFGDINSLRILCNRSRRWLERDKSTYLDKDRGIMSIALEGDELGKKLLKDYMSTQSIVNNVEKYLKEKGYTF